MDALIDGLNNDRSGRFTAFYSTPADYMKAKLASVKSFPTVVGDFMPLNDDIAGHNIWAGESQICLRVISVPLEYPL